MEAYVTFVGRRGRKKAFAPRHPLAIQYVRGSTTRWASKVGQIEMVGENVNQPTLPPL